jgi:hypothetical protein
MGETEEQAQALHLPCLLGEDMGAARMAWAGKDDEGQLKPQSKTQDKGGERNEEGSPLEYIRRSSQQLPCQKARGAAAIRSQLGWESGGFFRRGRRSFTVPNIDYRKAAFRTTKYRSRRPDVHTQYTGSCQLSESSTNHPQEPAASHRRLHDMATGHASALAIAIDWSAASLAKSRLCGSCVRWPPVPFGRALGRAELIQFLVFTSLSELFFFITFFFLLKTDTWACERTIED